MPLGNFLFWLQLHRLQVYISLLTEFVGVPHQLQGSPLSTEVTENPYHPHSGHTLFNLSASNPANYSNAADGLG